MHELSLAQSVLEIIEEAARTQHFRRVRTVVLEIGQLAAVEADAMRFCFDSVVRGTLAEGAALQIVEIAGRGRCLDCEAMLAMAEPYGLCPACGSPRLQVVAGNRMRVKDLSVE